MQEVASSGVSGSLSSHQRYIYIPMTAAYRAPKGTASDARGIYVKVTPELFEAYERAAAERGITKRSLIEAALAREIADPSLTAPQEELIPLKTA